MKKASLWIACALLLSATPAFAKKGRVPASGGGDLYAGVLKYDLNCEMASGQFDHHITVMCPTKREGSNCEVYSADIATDGSDSRRRKITNARVGKYFDRDVMDEPELMIVGTEFRMALDGSEVYLGAVGMDCNPR